MFPLTLVQKQELNFHLIGSLNEYFKFPPLAKIAKLRQCEFVRLRGTANLITCFKNCKRVCLALFVIFWKQKRNCSPILSNRRCFNGALIPSKLANERNGQKLTIFIPNVTQFARKNSLTHHIWPVFDRIRVYIHGFQEQATKTGYILRSKTKMAEMHEQTARWP